MKTRMSAIGVITVIAVLLSAATAAAQGNKPSAPVTVTNTPLPVTINSPLTVTGTFSTAGTPAQLILRGIFEEGSVNLADVEILGPRSYTLPAGYSRLLVRHVSCRAITAPGQKVQIFLDAEYQLPTVGGTMNLIELIPDNEIDGALPQARQVASAAIYAFVGITTPGGPAMGDTLRLSAQKDGTTGTGGVTCTVGGELFQ